MEDIPDELLEMGDLSFVDDKTDRKRRRQSLRIEGHLNNPIVPDECLFLLEFSKFSCKRHKSIKKYMAENNYKVFIYDACLSPWTCLYKYICRISKNTKTINNSLLNSNNIKDQFSSVIRAASQNYILHRSVFMNMTLDELERERVEIKEPSNETQNRIDHLYEFLVSDDTLLKFFTQKVYVEQLKDKFIGKDYSIGSFIQIDKRLHIEKEVFLWNCPIHKKTVGPTPLLLGSLDYFQSQFVVYLYTLLSDYFSKYNTSLSNQFLQINDFCLALRDKLQEDFFTVMKTWDSLVIGYICKNKESDLGNDNLFYSCVESLMEITNEVSRIINVFCPINDTPEDIKIKLEFSTLNRMYGHPLLYIEPGLTKLRKYTFANLKIDYDLLGQVEGLFIAEFIQSYIKKEGTWPSINFTSAPHPIILDHYNSKTFPNELEFNKIPLNQWKVIQFNKIFEYNYAPDTSELLSDKACSPPLRNWTQMYDQCAFENLYNQKKPKIPIVETRVMLRYLKGEENETLDAVNALNNGQRDQDNSIVVTARKERELNRKGRLFIKQTYTQRLIQTSMESNINNHVYPYIQEQTMSDTELRLKKRTASLNKMLKNPNVEIINLDLISWNMFQRHDVIHQFAQHIDDMHDLKNVYKDSHIWMQTCFVLTNSRVNPPKIAKNGMPTLGPFCHIGQKGGFEGMRQKLWTIPTIYIIKYTAWQLGIKISLMGQGDNQVILVKWLSFQLSNKNELRDQFLTLLRSNFEKLGMFLKQSETWVSNRLFEYGKQRYLYGCQVSGGIKRAKRIIPEDNDGLPTLESMLTTITTGTEALSMVDYNPGVGFIINNIEISNALLRKINFSNALSCPVDLSVLLVALLNWNLNFGGIPTSTYLEHVIRGVDDVSTVWVSIMSHLKVFCPSSYNILSRLMPRSFRSSRDPQTILNDIFSLNLPTLHPPTVAVTNVVKNCLMEYTTNPEIKNVLNVHQMNVSDLCKALISCDPPFMPLLHSILHYSNYGVVKSLQSKLTNVQSIVKLTRNLMDTDPYVLLENTEISYLKTIQQKVENAASKRSPISIIDTYIKNQNICSYETTRKIRTDAWGFEPIGVTKPVPWEQFQLTSYDVIKQKQPNNDGILVSTSKALQNQTQIWKDSMGPCTSYFGSFTKKRIIKAKIHLDNPSPFLDALKSLVHIRSIIVRDNCPGLQTIVDLLISEKVKVLQGVSDIELEQIKYIADSSAGGNELHRYFSLFQNSGALINFVYNITTHIVCSTGNMKKVQRGGDDFNIFFQMAFLFSMSYILEMTNICPIAEIEPQYLLIFNCPTCTHELPQLEFKMDKIPRQLIRNSEAQVLNFVKVLRQQLKDHAYTSLQYYKTSFSSTEVIFSLSITNGIKIGKRIDMEYNSVLAEKTLLGYDSQPGTYAEINLTEIKACNLFLLICGIIFESTTVRNCIPAFTHYTSNWRYKSNILGPLVSVCILTGRLSELCVLINHKIDSYHNSVSVYGCAQLLFKPLMAFIQSNVLDIIFIYWIGPSIPYSLIQRQQLVDWISRHVEIIQEAYLNTESNRIRELNDRLHMTACQLKETYASQLRLKTLIKINISTVELTLDNFKIVTGTNILNLYSENFNKCAMRHLEMALSPLLNDELIQTVYGICALKFANISYDDLQWFMGIFTELNKDPHVKELHTNILRDKKVQQMNITMLEGEVNITQDFVISYGIMLITLKNLLISQLKSTNNVLDPFYTQLEEINEQIDDNRINLQKIKTSIYAIKIKLENINKYTDRALNDFCSSLYSVLELYYPTAIFRGIKMIPQDLISMVWRIEFNAIKSDDVQIDLSRLLGTNSVFLKKPKQRAGINIRCHVPINPTVFVNLNTLTPILIELTRVDLCRVQEVQYLRRIGSPAGSLSTSPSLYLSIILKIPPLINKIKESKRIMALADGAGTLLQVISHLSASPDIQLFFNTLCNNLSEQVLDVTRYIPPAFLGEKCFPESNLMTNSERLILGNSDILTSVFADKLKKFFDSIDFLTIDMETKNLKQYEELLHNMYNYINLLNTEGTLIFKIRVSYVILKKLLNCFKDVNFWAFVPPQVHPIRPYLFILYTNNLDVSSYLNQYYPGGNQILNDICDVLYRTLTLHIQVHQACITESDITLVAQTNHVHVQDRDIHMFSENNLVASGLNERNSLVTTLNPYLHCIVPRSISSLSLLHIFKRGQFSPYATCYEYHNLIIDILSQHIPLNKAHSLSREDILSSGFTKSNHNKLTCLIYDSILIRYSELCQQKFQEDKNKENVSPYLNYHEETNGGGEYANNQNKRHSPGGLHLALLNSLITLFSHLTECYTMVKYKTIKTKVMNQASKTTNATSSYSLHIVQLKKTNLNHTPNDYTPLESEWEKLSNDTQNYLKNSMKFFPFQVECNWLSEECVHSESIYHTFLSDKNIEHSNYELSPQDIRNQIKKLIQMLINTTSKDS